MANIRTLKESHARVTDARAVYRRSPSLAAAGTLALRGDPAGADQLLDGLGHERWEVRWWSLTGLAALQDGRFQARLVEAARVETDEWLKRAMEERARREPMSK